MKKIISLILVLTMILCCSLICFADGSQSGSNGGGSSSSRPSTGGGSEGGSGNAVQPARVITMNGADVYVNGDTVTLDVKIQGCPPIKSLLLYDLWYETDVVEFVSGTITAPSNYIISNIDENGEIVIAYENETDCNGKIATLTFKSKSKIDGTLVGYKGIIRYDDNGIETSLDVPHDDTQPGHITVKARPTSNSGGGGGGISSYTIKFETNGSDEIKAVKVVRNKTITEPTIPVKDGYTFDGWYTDEELTNKYDFTTKVTKSFTLYAKWVENKADTDNTDDTKPEDTTPVETKNPFADVNNDDWFYNAVMFAYENDITSGISETEFAPQGKVTRGQFITMLCRAYDIPEMTGDNFDDSGDTWYTGYLAAAKQLGISNGVGDNRFAPEKEITREEMVTLIYNYLKSIGETSETVNETSFTDDDMISEWAKSAVSFASSNGYVNGKDNNMFDPQGTATRAELAQIFYNILAK